MFCSFSNEVLDIFCNKRSFSARVIVNKILIAIISSRRLGMVLNGFNNWLSGIKHLLTFKFKDHNI